MKRTKSGSAWMHEHVTDAYVKQAQREGYRSRAAYKLLEIDKRDRLIRPGTTVVDLGAAPGSWCQVVAQKQKGQGRIFGIDLLPVGSMAGMECLEGDFASDAGLAWLEERLQGKQVDLVLSDMAPNLSGVGLRDQAQHYALCELALAFSVQWLKPRGAFLVKVFHGVGFEEYRRQMRAAFETVQIRKPDASRERSNEIYLLGKHPMKARDSALESI